MDATWSDETGSMATDFLDSTSAIGMADDIDDDVASFQLVIAASEMSRASNHDNKPSRGGSAPGKAKKEARDFEGRYQIILEQ